MTEESTGTSTTTGQDNTNAGTVDASANGWLNQLPDDIKAHEAFKGVDTIESLAQRHVDLYLSQPNIPTSPDGYELTLPDGYNADAAEISQFKQIAHSVKMTQEQVAKLIAYDADRAKRVEDARTAIETKELETAQGELRTKWGVDYDKNIAIANRAVEKFGGKELVEALKVTGFGRNVQMVRAFYEIGKAISEDNTTDGQATLPFDSGPARTTYGMPMLKFPSMEQ